MQPLVRSLTTLAFLALFVGTGEAQERHFTVSGSLGSGLSFGGAGGETRMRRAPLFLDAEFRSWVSESGNVRDPVVGLALRMEVEGRASVAFVPRVGLMRKLGRMEFRPFLGAVAFVAPFSLVGAELGAEMALTVHGRSRLIVTALADAYVWGSDLPDGSALVTVAATVGFEVVINP
ncbi:MAG: hypothetical protein AAF411_16870 [Myxococcota bacterium]